MTGLTKPITKRNIVRRQSRGYFWGLTALAGIMSADYHEESILAKVVFFFKLMILVCLAVYLLSCKMLHYIRTQEGYLCPGMEEDMRGVRMQGFFSTGVEAVYAGDWYLLLSYYGVVAVNRRYIAGVKKIERHSEWRGRYSITPMLTLRITFQTVTQETMTFTTGNAWQAAEDLCSWLGMEPEERRE